MSDEKIVYLIRPLLGGLSNNVQVQIEDGEILYQVKSKPFSPLGRVYQIFDATGKNMIMTTKQDHTAIFPRHTLLRDGKPIGSVGQLGVLPQNYFIQIGKLPRLKIHVGGFESIFRLKGGEGVLAEVAPHRSTWIVVLSTDQNKELLIISLALIYRENTIGG